MSSKQVKIKPRGSGNSVTLFPFLAVLLCTMGGLIMLLIVITRNVKEQNISVNVSIASEQHLSEAETQHILGQIQQETDEADWYAENFNQSKAAAEKDLADVRAELASKEHQTEKIKDELDRLAKLAETLQKHEKINQDTEYLKQALTQRKQQQKALEDVLSRMQKESQQDAKSYAIIPYRGKNGTFRRPVYVECKNGKVIIQPEGVELNLNDFILADRPDNPLDTSLRVVRQYYTETNQVQRGTEPYPLLVVRPSGVEAYSAVREAMGSWVNEYGYELVDEDWEMKYPAASDELRSRLEKQLESSRIRMSAYIAAMKAEYIGNAMAQRQFTVNRSGVTEQTEESRRLTASQSEGTNYRARGTNPLISRNNSILNNNNNNVTYSSPDKDKYIGKINEENTKSGSVNSPAGYARSSIPYKFPDETSDGRQQTTEYNTPSNFAIQPVPVGGMPAVAMSATTTPEMQQTVLSPEEQTLMPKPSGNPLFPKHQKHDEDESKRADNWALRGMEKSATAIKRNIKIRCEADKFVLTEQQGLIGIRVIPITDSVWSATDKLVIQIWDFMESWETAGDNYFWLPVLQAEVVPGGEQRFGQLCGLLNNSGFIIEKRDTSLQRGGGFNPR